MEPTRLSDPQDWVEKHGDYLFRSALLRLRDRAEAEEVVQETFLAAWQGRERFAGQSSERTWLVGILKHKITDYFRRTSRERTNPHGDVAEGELADLFDEDGRWRSQAVAPREWHDPSSVVDRQQFWQALRHCIERLPARTASAFTLREIDEVPGEQICSMLEISKANLWVMLHRARVQLRRCLESSYMNPQ